MTHQQKKIDYYAHEYTNRVADECCEHIEDMLHELQVRFKRSGKRLYGPCPVHGGDNPAAWNIYPDGDYVRGIWVCRTHHCEKKYRRNIIGFVRGVLEAQRGHCTWAEAVDWMAQFLGYSSIKEVKPINKEEIDRLRYDSIQKKLTIKPRHKKSGWQRNVVRSRLQIPATYYLNRGYTKDILDKYDIGFSSKIQRVVVPIYNDDYEFVIGTTQRTIHKKCEKCNYYHNPLTSCPTTLTEQMHCSKWKNNEGFESAHCLYNYWFAKPYIKQSNTIIIVEGPGDVWRLEEAGIHNSVALLGCELSEEQLTIIESCWAMNIIVMTDNDEAGINAAKEIKEQLGRTHRLYFPVEHFKKKDDVGDLNSSVLVSEVSPILEIINNLHTNLGIVQ
jgi:5S rRNA maturation endonuclease (ribonuclease M5)